MCRREGASLCGREKCAFKRRGTVPGVHGAKKTRRPSIFGSQLREKQKAKRLYNILERQFRGYFEKAVKKQGDTGKLIIQMLETRFDNTIYRLGFAKTRRQARQFVSHSMFDINGKKVNIPSYQVKVGDTITLREVKKNKKAFENISEQLQKTETPSWLLIDPASVTGKVLSLPEGENLKTIFDPKLIVEFYSR